MHELIPKIIFEDAHLVVISKPYGLLSQGDYSGEKSLVDWAASYFGRPYVGLVHRLDRDTSGLMIIAKRSKAAMRLTDSLQSGVLQRAYLAWVHGPLDQPETWIDQLTKDSKTNRVKTSDDAEAHSKNAKLLVEPQEHLRGLTLVKFTLDTGRSHQIRVQAASRGHAVLGDPKYGNQDGFPRLALHSTWIKFPHPKQNEDKTHSMLEFTEDLPKELSKEVLQKSFKPV